MIIRPVDVYREFFFRRGMRALICIEWVIGPGSLAYEFFFFFFSYGSGCICIIMSVDLECRKCNIFG